MPDIALKKAYLPGLDGIRGIAIAAVLLFHAGIRWFQGGYLGVDVFFVISGYLITGILAREQLSQSCIDLGGFYKRRGRRLMPALVVMLLVTLLCAVSFIDDVAGSTARDLFPAFIGFSNWWFIFHHQSYFEAMGRPPLLQHTWSLAVEAQFYFIWPVLTGVLLRAWKVSGVFVTAVLLSLVSAGTMLLMGAGTDLVSGPYGSRIYFGTDTHSMGLFLGAAIATAEIMLMARLRSLGKALLWVREAAGLASLVGLVALFHFAGLSSTLFYRAAFPLASGLAAMLMILAMDPETLIGKGLAARPLRWIGERSYSLYVWHWPIYQVTRPGLDVPAYEGWNLLLRLALTFGIAELSYRVVETPLRQGALGRLWSWRPQLMQAALVSTAAATLTLVLYSYNAPPSATSAAESRGSQSALQVSKTIQLPGVNAAMNSDVLKTPTMLLGDSVMLSVSHRLTEQVNVVKVDAVIGRQAAEIKRLVDQKVAEGTIEPAVILDLGNNGVVEESTLKSILEALKVCRRVVVVNACVPRPWQDDDNALLAKIVPTYPNAVLADWRAAADHHPEYFEHDGIHARDVGAKAYADMVVAALESTKPPRP